MKKRTKRLIEPGLQLRLTLTFIGLTTVAMLLQFVLLGGRLMTSLRELDGGAALAEEVPGAMLSVFAASLLVIAPVMLLLGIVVTHRFAGPAHRFESFLREVAAGQAKGPCAIRSGDEMQSLCEAINLATEPLWERGGEEAHEGAEAAETQREAA